MRCSIRRGGRIRSFFGRYGEDYLFMLPYLVLFFLFTVIPVVASVFLSLTYFNVLEAPALRVIFSACFWRGLSMNFPPRPVCC